MDQLIKVDVKNNQQVLSARDLYSGLDIAQRFSRWVLNNFEMFEEGIDYVPCTSSTQLNQYGGTKEINDYTITIGMAKELAMMVRNDQGKMYRKYFLTLEEKWNDPKEVVKRGYDILLNENNQLKLENKRLLPKARFADSVSSASTDVLVSDMAKILKQNGVDIGQQRLFKWLRTNKYLGSRGSSYNIPTQYSMNLQLFRIKESTVRNPNGQTIIRRTAKVTGKGQRYFIKKFLKEIEVTEQ